MTLAARIEAVEAMLVEVMAALTAEDGARRSDLLRRFEKARKVYEDLGDSAAAEAVDLLEEDFRATD